MNTRYMAGTMCSILALAAACEANAQAAASATTPTGGAGSGGQGASSSATAVGEVVVTAQKSSQTLQRVPAAVSVVGSARLAAEGVTNLTQVSNVATGLSITPVRTQAFVFERGVGQTLTTPNADPAVAVNVNGVYMPSEIAGTAFFDVDRIELLPGPQGTLYGRNSTGGVLNLITRTPGTTFGADGFVELGNYNRVQSVIAVDIPLSDSLTSRTVGTIIQHRGYFNNGEDDQKTAGARETLVWAPSDRTKVTAIATYTNDGGIGDVLQNVPFSSPCGPRCATFDPKALGYSNRANTFQASLNVQQKLTDDLTMTYVGGYSRLGLGVVNSIFTGPPLGPLFLNERIDSQSHEVRLNGRWGKLDGILGVYYFDQNAYYQTKAWPVGNPFIDPFNGASSGEALFGQVTYSLLDNLRLTAGGRYSYTQKSINGTNQTYTANWAALIANDPYTGSSKLYHGDWKVGFEYDLAPRSLLYGNIATGFTPGGFSTDQIGPAEVPNVVTQAASFLPVYLTAYTAGVKNKLDDGRLTLNLEGFYYDYQNYQVSQRALTGQNQVFNAKKATVEGVEADSTFALSPNDKLSTGVTYLSAIANTLVTPAGNFGGYDLPFSPKWTVNAFYEHAFDVGNDAQIRANINYKYTSLQWSLYTHAAGFNIDPYSWVDLNVGYFPGNGRWSMQAFVRNAGNVVVKTSCGNAVSTVVPGGRTAGCDFQPPRTYGVTFNFKT